MFWISALVAGVLLAAVIKLCRIESISILPLEWVFYPVFVREAYDYDTKGPALSRVNLGPVFVRIKWPVSKEERAERQKYQDQLRAEKAAQKARQRAERALR